MTVKPLMQSFCYFLLYKTEVARDFQILDSPPSLTRKQHCYVHHVAPTHTQLPRSSRVNHTMDSSLTRGVCEYLLLIHNWFRDDLVLIVYASSEVSGET